MVFFRFPEKNFEPLELCDTNEVTYMTSDCGRTQNTHAPTPTPLTILPAGATQHDRSAGDIRWEEKDLCRPPELPTTTLAELFDGIGLIVLCWIITSLSRF